MAVQPADGAGEGRLVVGLVRGINGLRGLVRIEILTDNESRFDVGSTLFVEGTDAPLTIASSHRDGPGMLVGFREIRTREAADALRDAYLVADPVPLDEGTYFWHDIIGCAVLSHTGEELGTVSDVFRVGGSEVYEVRGPRGEILIPAVAAVVRELNPAQKRIVVDADALGLTDPAQNEIRP
jgi:16S rRNA processing protein RimM